MACGSIDKLITSEKRVVVLGASFIYINIANADPMANDIKRDARHIIIRPGEELKVFSLEDNACSLEGHYKARVDAKLSIRLTFQQGVGSGNIPCPCTKLIAPHLAYTRTGRELHHKHVGS
ncbi:unnamed protein product [Prunus brigantina]